jgi:anti-anti-sigma regulatory factor
VVVVAITGEFDRTTAEHLRAELIDIGAVCVGVLAVDLSACTRLGETGIEVLGSAIVRSASGRFKVQVWADHPDVTTALHAAGINHQAGPVRPISSPG